MLARSAQGALQNLAFLHPNVIFPTLVEHLKAALTTVTEGGRMMSGLGMHTKET